MPNAVPRMFLTHPVETTCRESEGEVPTHAVGSGSVSVLIVGRVPAVGDDVLARKVGALWVAGSGRRGGILCPPCPGGIDAETLILTDPKFGMVTLRYSAQFNGWYGCKLVSVTGVAECVWNRLTETIVPVTTPLAYRIVCGPTAFALSAWYVGCHYITKLAYAGTLCATPVFWFNNWPMAAECGEVPYHRYFGDDQCLNFPGTGGCPDVCGIEIPAIAATFPSTGPTSEGEVVSMRSCSPVSLTFRVKDRSIWPGPGPQSPAYYHPGIYGPGIHSFTVSEP